MVTTTTVYSFQKPAVAGDEDQWGTYLNNNIDKYESILTGNTTITSVVITTADINGGTLDNVVIGGTTAAAVTGTTITGTSFVSSGDMTFGDNNKAIFGAGSDLQIYHDGSNSYIDDAGTGNLTIRANQINFDKYTGEALARFRADGNTELFYDNAAKLATTSTGIDVTGTVTADGLTVDGDANLSGTAVNFDLDETDTTDLNTRFRQSAGQLFVQTANDAKSLGYNRLNINHTTGDISFYEDTGTTAKFFWDASAESLGIGTSSPTDGKLHVVSDGNASEVIGSFEANNGTQSLDLGYYYIKQRGGNHLSFDVGSAERMRINSSGQVGIGTSSPQATIHVHDSATSSNNLQLSNAATGATSSDGIVIGMSSANAYFFNRENTDLRFGTNNSERMRIDGSGVVRFANTSMQIDNSGNTATGCSVGTNGVTHIATSANNTSLLIQRVSDTGTDNAIFFLYGSSGVGSVQVDSTSTSFNTSSDYRLKENVTNISDGITRVKQLTPKRFNFIADADKTVDGFLAHEAQSVVPEAVTGVKDQVEVWADHDDLPEGVSVGDNKLDNDGNTIPIMQGIDQSKLVPVLTAALQEAITKIETLETKVAALEG